MLRNLFRLCRITKSNNNNGQVAEQQISYLGKTANGMVCMPYGFFANIPPDTLAGMMSIQGHPDNRALFPIDTKAWPKLEEGEVAFYHPKTDNIIKWLANGDLVIDNGTALVTLSGNTMTFDCNVVFNGTMTNNGKDVGDTHAHIGSPTAPVGAQSDTGAVV